MPFKPCRCLLDEVRPDLAGIVREMNEALPPEDRAAPEVYTHRLDACRACGHLDRGTCRLCGCYVEIRAARQAQFCPDLPDRWID